MDQEETFANLRSIFADLYPDQASARRIASDAGLNLSNIPFSTHAANNWHAILREAEHTNRTENVFAVVLREYGANQNLIQAIDNYRGFLDAPPDKPVPEPNGPHERELRVKGPEPGTTGVYLIEGEGFTDYEKGDSLVVYDDFGGATVAIALLKVTRVNPDSLSAQAVLIHPSRQILNGLAVDDRLEYLPTNECFPAVEYGAGYLLREERIRLRANSGVQESATLIAMEPEIADGYIHDYLDTSTAMRVTRIGQGGTIAAVELIEGEWPQSGTIVRQKEPESTAPSLEGEWSPVGTTVKRKEQLQSETSNPVPNWFPTAGALLLVATVGFLMYLFLAGANVDSDNFPIFAVLAAFSAAGAVFFLGGWATASGGFTLPGFLNNPISFGVTGGLAGFVIVLIIIRLAFGYIIPPLYRLHPRQVQRRMSPPKVDFANILFGSWTLRTMTRLKAPLSHSHTTWRLITAALTRKESTGPNFPVVKAIPVLTSE